MPLPLTRRTILFSFLYISSRFFLCSHLMKAVKNIAILVVIMLLWMENVLYIAIKMKGKGMKHADTPLKTGYGTENVVCVLMFANSLEQKATTTNERTNERRNEWTKHTFNVMYIHVQRWIKCFAANSTRRTAHTHILHCCTPLKNDLKLLEQSEHRE